MPIPSQSPLRPSQARTALDGGAILVVVEHIGDQGFNIYKLSKKNTRIKKNILRTGPYAPCLCKVVGYLLDMLCQKRSVIIRFFVLEGV